MNTVKQIDVIALSTYIVQYVTKLGHDVSHLKLQKLIYYVDAWHNVFLNRPLIANDFEAWMHGPVVREVWDYYKEQSVLHDILQPAYEEIDLSAYVNSEQMEIINDVLDEYGDKTAYYLECLTHEEKPWIVARIGYVPSDRCDQKIDKHIMKRFYEGKLYGQTETE